MDIVYSPHYYSDSECFIKFVVGLHRQFVTEARYARLMTVQRMVTKNRFGVRWHMAVQFWFIQVVQDIVRAVIGDSLDTINQEVCVLLSDKRAHIKR